MGRPSIRYNTGSGLARPSGLTDFTGLQLANNTSLVGPAAGGYTSLTPVVGDLTISTTNATVTGVDVTGTIFINATGVTVRGFRAQGGIRHNSDNCRSSLIFGEIGPPSGVGVVSPGTGMAVNPGYALWDYMNVHNGPDITWGLIGTGYTPIIRRSWLHDMESPDDNDPHADCFQISGGDGTVIVEDSFLDARTLYYTTTSLNPPAGRRLSMHANSAIQSGDFPTNGGLIARRTLFAGGSYSTQLLDATTSSGWNYTLDGCWWGRGNVTHSVGSESFPINGPYSSANSLSSHFTWTNNRYADVSGGGVWTAAETLGAP